MAEETFIVGRAYSGPQRGAVGFWRRVEAAWSALVAVKPVDVGRANDGLVSMGRSGSELDKEWYKLQEELKNVLVAWRSNPLARRIVGLITAYVVGDGIKLNAAYGPLRRYLAAWSTHEKNQLAFRQGPWCDELSRSGELFIALHTNPIDGISYVRSIPSSSIDRVDWRQGDYEHELAYHEIVDVSDPDHGNGGRVWLSGQHPDVNVPHADGSLSALVLHFAVNRPVGCTRGESDLAPILSWLLRYSRWLEDRVQLNAAVRAFLWILRVPQRLIESKRREYQQPPQSGTVIIAEEGAETWEAVTPKLEAADAEKDGRAIRWMVVAGGPGIGLTDLGEAETSNLATARAMGEQRLRFMRQRQAYFGYVLAQVAVTAYNRAVLLGRWRGRPCTVADVLVGLPDISAADNADLAAAAGGIAGALNGAASLGLRGPTWARTVLRLVFRFASEPLSEADLDRILWESDLAAEPGADAVRDQDKED